jgi:large-conductance mechanosensitive channel
VKEIPRFAEYGAFLQTIFDFLIIAFVIFIAVKGINKLKKPTAPPAAAPPRRPPPRRRAAAPGNTARRDLRRVG